MSAAADALDKLFRRYLNRFPRIIAVKKRVCHAIAIAATYRTSRKQSFNLQQCSNACRQIKKIHRLWVFRLWSLSSNDLWLLQRGLDPDPAELEQTKLRRSFKRLAGCISRNVVYSKFRLRLPKKRVCNKTNVCPHCWANTVAAVVYTVRRVINVELNSAQEQPVTVSSVVLERMIPARVGGVNFSAPETLRQESLFLRHALQNLQRFKTVLRYRVKKYSATAIVGVVWRVVLIPKNDHWLLQLRILCVHRLKKPKLHKLLTAKLADVSCVKTMHVEFPANLNWARRKCNDAGPDVDNYAQLLEFNRYPLELLTSDIELTSAAITASAGIHMIGGMRAFRRVSTALVRERAIVQRAQDRKKRGCYARQK